MGRRGIARETVPESTSTVHNKVKKATQPGWSKERSSKIPKMMEDNMTKNKHQPQQEWEGGPKVKTVHSHVVIYNSTGHKKLTMNSADKADVRSKGRAFSKRMLVVACPVCFAVIFIHTRNLTSHRPTGLPQNMRSQFTLNRWDNREGHARRTMY